MLSIERITDAIKAVTKSFANLTISHLKALTIDETLTVTGNTILNGGLDLAGQFTSPKIQSDPTIVTATTGGGTTGLIPANTSYVAADSDSADKQISLPIGTDGDCIVICTGDTGCELISVVAADKANNVTIGATNELALAANSIYVCRYSTPNKWIVNGITKFGAPIGKTTAALTSITHTAPSTPDYALQDLVQNTGFGFATADEGNTLLSVVLNLQQRLAQLETGAALTPDSL